MQFTHPGPGEQNVVRAVPFDLAVVSLRKEAGVDSDANLFQIGTDIVFDYRHLGIGVEDDKVNGARRAGTGGCHGVRRNGKR